MRILIRLVVAVAIWFVVGLVATLAGLDSGYAILVGGVVAVAYLIIAMFARKRQSQ